MPHDGHHHHHDHLAHHPAAIGHNRPRAEHLASHPHAHPAAAGAGADDEVQLLIDAFIDGYRLADDKTSFLRMAHVPFELAGGEGAPALKLIDVEITDAWQVGTAGPGFASQELVYQPFPAALVRERTEMRFVYVSLTERRDVALRDMMALIGPRAAA